MGWAGIVLVLWLRCRWGLGWARVHEGGCGGLKVSEPVVVGFRGDDSGRWSVDGLVEREVDERITKCTSLMQYLGG